MLRLSSLLIGCLLLALTAHGDDRVNWEITPRITAPGQPFRLQIQVDSDVPLGGAQNVGRDIRPPRGMALRLSGQILRPDSTEATLNFSGVAPEQEGEYVIPSFNLRFPRKMISVPEIKLIVSKTVAFIRTNQARAELSIPDRTFYVGELIRGSINMRGGEQESVVASFGLESVAEGFTFGVTSDRQPLPAEMGQGLQTSFELTPIREGLNEVIINGIMLIQSGSTSVFNNAGRDRPFTFRRRIAVEHVPQKGRPADWSGAIGKFTAEPQQASNEKPEVGEPIRLRAVLTGSGNLDRIVPPEIMSNEVWDVLPATERRRHAEEQRFFVYTLVPRLPGKQKTPEIRFSSFDPETKQFSRLVFASAEVTVTGNAPAKVDLVTRDPAAPIGSDAGLKLSGLAKPDPASGSLFSRHSMIEPLAASKLFWSSNGLALLLIVAATGVILIAGYLASHPQIIIHWRAKRGLQRAIRQATRARGDAPAFANIATGGLKLGCAAILGAETEAMTQSDILRVLPEAKRETLDALFDAADGNKFGSGTTIRTTNQEEALILLHLVRDLL
jgi:hypothetical protein